MAYLSGQVGECTVETRIFTYLQAVDMSHGYVDQIRVILKDASPLLLGRDTMSRAKLAKLLSNHMNEPVNRQTKETTIKFN